MLLQIFDIKRTES